MDPSVLRSAGMSCRVSVATRLANQRFLKTAGCTDVAMRADRLHAHLPSAVRAEVQRARWSARSSWAGLPVAARRGRGYMLCCCRRRGPLRTITSVPIVGGVRGERWRGHLKFLFQLTCLHGGQHDRGTNCVKCVPSSLQKSAARNLCCSTLHMPWLSLRLNLDLADH